MQEQEKQPEQKKVSNDPSNKTKAFDIAEYLPHLLSALCGVAGSYLLFGKPVQDHVKEMADRLIKMEKKINTLWEEREQNSALKKQALQGKHDEEEEDDDENFMLSKHQNGTKKRHNKRISRMN